MRPTIPTEDATAFQPKTMRMPNDLGVVVPFAMEVTIIPVEDDANGESIEDDEDEEG